MIDWWWIKYFLTIKYIFDQYKYIRMEETAARLTRILLIIATVLPVLSPGSIDGWNQDRNNILYLAQSNPLIQEFENLHKDKASISSLSPDSVI